MCLAVPAKIVDIHDLNAVVELEGVRRECNIAFIENPRVGDYVLLHAGFAMKKWSEEDVQELRDILAYDGLSAPEYPVGDDA